MILTVIICGLFAIAIFLFYVLGDDVDKHTAMEQHKLELPGDKINPQEMWMARLDTENKMLKKQLEFLETTLLEIKKNQTTFDKRVKTFDSKGTKRMNEFMRPIPKFNFLFFNTCI